MVLYKYLEDNKGRQGGEATFTITNAPNVVFNGPRNIASGQPITFTWNYTGDRRPPCNYRLVYIWLSRLLG